MRNLRPGQMAAFEDAAESSFVDEMEAHLHRVFAEELAYLPAQQWRALIRARVDQAHGLGLSLRGDVRRYLEVSIAERWPAAGPPANVADVLRRADLEPSARMDIIEQGLYR